MINQMRQGPSYNGKRNKAKLLLLWTIISLVENNILKKNIITLEFLEDRYYKILNDFNVPRTVIIYPFFYLKNDGFWHLKWKYDKEAIMVKKEGLGLIGYVANSTYTVIGESMSAGRLYDKIGKKATAKVVMLTNAGVICKICKKSLLEYQQQNKEIEKSEEPVKQN